MSFTAPFQASSTSPSTIAKHKPQPAAAILLSGSSGGVAGPSSIYPPIADEIASLPNGIPVLRLAYRYPGRNKYCVADVHAALKHLETRYAISRFVLVGWSFGGAPVFTLGGSDKRVVACATVASQTAGADGIGRIVWRLSLNGVLHIAPLARPVQSVLDVGTGTGIWAIEFAKTGPTTRVIGTDLSAIQPVERPTNCDFIVANAEEDWTFDEPFDYIHSRLLYFGMRDWPRYFRRCFQNLKPGGWVEAQECQFPGYDESYSGAGDESPYVRWSEYVAQALRKGGIDPAPGKRFSDLLQNQGFVNVEKRVIKWPASACSEEPVQKEIGRLTKPNVNKALDGVSRLLFTKKLGWEMEEVEAMILRVRAELDDPHKKPYT